MASRLTITEYLKKAAVLPIALLLFFLILKLRLPIIFRPVIIQLRFGSTLPIPVLFILMAIILSRRKTWIHNAGAFIFVTAVFAMALAGMWASGQTEGQVISGILPDTDAAFYYYDGLRFINGFSFSYFGARRIFFPAFLGVLLKITSNNIQVCLALLTFLVAVSCYYATKAVWHHLGTVPASLFFVLLFAFARLSVGKLMSENLGLVFGCFSFYFFMVYLEQKNKRLLWLASLLLVLGLVTRAGPIFIFPMIMVGVFLSDKSKKNFWQIFLISLLAVGVVIAAFVLLSSLVSPEDSIPFANFAHSLYGLATGGRGWGAIQIDHPEVFDLQEPELTKAIFDYSIQAIKDNPGNLIKGALLQYPQIINFPDRKGFFSFFRSENLLVYYLGQVALFVLFFYAIYSEMKNSSYKKYRMFFYALIGILLSVPLLPFNDFKEMRVYAAAIPYILIFPCMGLAALLEKLLNSKLRSIKTASINSTIPVALSILLMACTLLGPIFVWKLTAKNRPPTTIECAKGEDAIVAFIAEGSSFSLLKESDLYLDWLPYFHESRFRKNLHNLQDKIVMAFEDVHAPSLLTSTINLQNGDAVMLVFPNEEQARFNETQYLCGVWDDYDYSTYNANLFFVRSHE